MKTTTTLLAGAALALGLAGGAMAQDEPLQVGFVYVGSIGDLGWTYEHEQGRLAVEEYFGDAVETTYVENVPEGADAERVMTQMALSGADLIFTTSFGYMEPTNNVAARFPDVMFEHATGYLRNSPNVSTYAARFDPAVEAEAAQALIDQGADVILQHTDSTAPMTVLAEAGAIGFGQASDMGQFAPTPRVSSIIDNWAPYYIERVQAVMDGTWESSDVWGGIDSGMVEIGAMSDAIPEEVRASAQALADSIEDGSYHPFTGPINRQDGSVWLAEGETADDGTLLGMDFYVEGMTGDVPN